MHNSDFPYVYTDLWVGFQVITDDLTHVEDFSIEEMDFIDEVTTLLSFDATVTQVGPVKLNDNIMEAILRMLPLPLSLKRFSAGYTGMCGRKKVSSLVLNQWLCKLVHEKFVFCMCWNGHWAFCCLDAKAKTAMHFNSGQRFGHSFLEPICKILSRACQVPWYWLKHLLVHS